MERTWKLVMSQKPFGFFGISAGQQARLLVNLKSVRHKSLSASLAFLPTFTELITVSITRESQKPFGFFGISASSSH